MLDAEEAVELRALQARAYGREGNLTAEETARLAELNESRGGVTGSEAPARPSAGDPAGEEPVMGRRNHERTTSTSEPALRQASARRPRWPLIAIGFVVVFALGATAGWVLSRPPKNDVELTAPQAEWEQELLDAGEYDAGSVRAMAVEDDMVIWAATQSKGRQTCLVMGDAQERVPFCTSTDYVHSQGFDAVRTVDADGELKRQISARLFLTPEGAPAVVTGSFLFAPPDEFGAAYRDDGEAAVAEELVELGLDRTSLWVVGYDGRTPIWTGIKVATGQTCIAYDDAAPEPWVFCEELSAIGAGQKGLGFDRLDPETGATSSIMFTYGGGPSFLQITREPAPEGDE